MPSSSAQSAQALIDSFARVRQRLLDLSLRNQLLNFRFPQRSSVRFVDERIDFVHARLVEGRTLTLEPIRAVPDVFTENAVENPDFEARQSAFQQRQKQAHAAAQKIGVNTSFDLATTSSGTEEKHVDDRLQTLFFPQDLEDQLRKIAASARVALEETGSNILFLACGFLEWTDRPGDDVTRMAPLLLLPVQLEKFATDQATQTDSFRIRVREESLSSNVSLEEKLRQEFKIELPSRGEEATPEQWLASVAEFLKATGSSWSVRYQLCLGTFSFGRLLMWQDLGDARWSAGESPLLERPLITELLGGSQSSRDHSLSRDEVYDLENGAAAKELPPIVVDADSSQHSVLIDAAKNQNLVVQGPPGTGKSQTITNLIASALSRGQTVLFVTQKLAALEVVARRLSAVGLDPFCLQLHSHRTQKAEFLGDVRRRLSLRRTALPDQDAKTRTEQLKRRLQQYDDALHRRVEPIGLSPFQLFGRALHAQQFLNEVPEALRSLRIPGAQTLTLADVDAVLEEVRELDASAKGLLKTSTSVAEHPWFGVSNDTLDRPKLVESVKAWRTAVAQTCSLVEEVGRATETTPALSFQFVRLFAAAANRLPLGSGQKEVLVVAQSRAGLDALRQLHQQLTTAQAAWKASRAASPSAFSSKRLVSISERLDVLRRQLPEKFLISDLARFAADLEQLLKDLESSQRLTVAVRDVLRAELPATLQAVVAFGKTIELAQRVSGEALSVRTPSLFRRGAFERLQTALVRLGELRTRSKELGERFLPALQPDDAALKEHHRVIANSSWYSFLFSDYRVARRVFVAMAQGVRATRSAMLSGFTALASFREELRAFENEAALRELFNGRVDGLKTPIEAGIEAHAWARSLRDALSCLGPQGEVVARQLITANEDFIERVASLGSTEASSIAAVKRLAQTAQKYPSLVGSGEYVQALYGAIGSVVRQLAEVQRDALEFGAAGSETVESVFARVSAACDAMRIAEGLAHSELLKANGDPAVVLSLDPQSIRLSLDTAEHVWASQLPERICSWALSHEPSTRLSWLRSAGSHLAALGAECSVASERACRLGGMSETPWISPPSDSDLSTLKATLESALANESALNDWLWFARARRHLSKRSVGPALIRVVERHPEIDARAVAESAIFQTVAEHALGERSTLHQFQTATHESVRRDYAKADIAGLESARASIVAELLRRHVEPGVGSGPVKQFSELSLIKREVEKQRAHIPIRQLMSRAGTALQQLMPCFMMGPQSVAQYLPAEGVSFDLVIMDEASQMRPEDALGTLARGAQAIIVGDPRQLPPTSFFDAQQSDDEDEVMTDEGPRALGRTILESSESILEAASACFPTRMLQWHYRSKHHSLIEYCNHRFYDGRLIVFPSPEETGGGSGVIFERVDGATYRSGSRINIVEAQKVADAVARHAERSPKRSLVVVTLNATQRELIERLVADAAKQNRALLKFIETSDEKNEPFTVKNLENVQGDERDDVFVSLTFGPDENNRLVQNFGPINQSNGHRRLNVLFTRARQALRVFCSFDPAALRVGDGSPLGLQVLSQYLCHAAKVGPSIDVMPAAKQPDSPFELSVAAALKGRGLDVQSQVGVAGYFIDIGIRDPRRPGVFLLGVECDGESYHRSKSARDRDRLRDAQLQTLGWTLHRIWSTDWFRNPNAELQRIVAKVEAISGGRPLVY